MPAIRPRLFNLFLALLAGAGWASGCSVDDAAREESRCTGLSCTDLPPAGNEQEVETETMADAGAPSAPPAKAQCGVGTCLPDDVSACSDYSEPAPPAEPSPDGGVPIDAGADAGSALDAGLDAGADSSALDGSFTRPPMPRDMPSRYACQVSVTETSLLQRTCGAAGTQDIDEACTSSRDCAPGLGCVGTVRSGRCLPYCCAIGPDTCQQGYYCAERPLRAEAFGEAEGPLVPVCDRADDCSLGEPANCADSSCVCGPETACTLVRPDGTTACLKPGEGTENQGCPCARGYVCSQATSPPTCVKMCDLDAEDSDACGYGVCQATPALPAGWGVCVGGTSNSMRVP